MPENEVKVSITGDDSGYRQAIQGLQAELNKLAGAKGPPIGPDLAAVGESAHKAAGGVKEAHEKLELFGRAGEKVKEQVKDFKQELTHFALGFVGVAGAFEMVSRAFEEGSAFETTQVRFQNLLGSSEKTKDAFEGLEKVSDQTGISIHELADASESLYAAGTGIDHLTGSIDNLAKVAIVTGSSVGEITDIFDRIQAHGEVSFRELFRLTQATGGATRDLAIQYRDLPKILEASTAAIDATAKIQEMATGKAEKHKVAIEDMGKQLGIVDVAWKMWGRNVNTVNAGTIVPGFGGEWAQRAAQTFLDDFNMGVKQLSAETGIAQKGIIEMVNSGDIGMDTLLEKGKEWRADLADRAKQPFETAKAQISAQTQQQQYAILDTIKQKLTDVSSNADAFARASETWGQKVKVAAHEVEKAFEGVGLGWTTAMKPALDALANKDIGGALSKLPDGIKLAAVAFGIFEAAVAASKIPAFLKGLAELWQGITKSTKEAELAEVAYNAEQAKAPPGQIPTPGGKAAPGGAKEEPILPGQGPGKLVDAAARKVGPALPGLGEVGIAAYAAQLVSDQLESMSPTKGSEIQKKLTETEQPQGILGWRPPWWTAEQVREGTPKMLKAPGAPGEAMNPEEPMVTGGAFSLTGAPGETKMSRGLFLSRMHEQATTGIPQPTEGIEGATTTRNAAGQSFTTLPMPGKGQPGGAQPYENVPGMKPGAPIFRDPEVNAFIKLYGQFREDYAAAEKAAKSGDASKLADIQVRAGELSTQATTAAGKVGADESESFRDYLSGGPEGNLLPDSAPMGVEPFKDKRKKTPAAQIGGGGGGTSPDEGLWEKSAWEQQASHGVGSYGPMGSGLPSGALAAGYQYDQPRGQVVNKQGQDVGTYDYFTKNMKQFESASKKDDVGSKIDTSNEHLKGIYDTLGTVLKAGGGA